MDARDALRASVVGSLAAVLAVLAVWTSGPPRADAPILGEAGEPLRVPARPGQYHALFEGHAVLVIVAPAEAMPGAEAATPSVTHPEDASLRIVAVSAVSTFHGCRVQWLPATAPQVTPGEASGPGVLFDPCRQSMWDPFRGGAVLAGPDGLAPMPVLELDLRGQSLLGQGFSADPTIRYSVLG